MEQWFGIYWIYWLEDEEEDGDGFDFARGGELHEGLYQHYGYAAQGHGCRHPEPD